MKKITIIVWLIVSILLVLCAGVLYGLVEIVAPFDIRALANTTVLSGVMVFIGLCACCYACPYKEDKPTPRYMKDQIFESLSVKNENGRNIYEGFIKLSVLEDTTIKQIIQTLDDNAFDFGYHIDIDKGGKFICIIWTDLLGCGDIAEPEPKGVR